MLAAVGGKEIVSRRELMQLMAVSVAKRAIPPSLDTDQATYVEFSEAGNRGPARGVCRVNKASGRTLVLERG